MDTTVKKPSISKSKVADSSLATEKEAEFLGKGDAELKSLLSRRGGISKRPKNERLKVQWNDRHGKKLAQVLEFEPSDEGESEDDEGPSYMLASEFSVDGGIASLKSEEFVNSTAVGAIIYRRS